MLREIFLKNALQAYIDGEDVQALIRTGEDEYCMVPIEKLFDDARFLVDRKAARLNPEFEAAIQEMVSQDPPPVPQEDAAKIAAETTKSTEGKQRKLLDMGKVVALRNAGWSMKKIADEMGVSEGTIWNNLKKLEEAKESDKRRTDR